MLLSWCPGALSFAAPSESMASLRSPIIMPAPDVGLRMKYDAPRQRVRQANTPLVSGILTRRIAQPNKALTTFGLDGIQL